MEHDPARAGRRAARLSPATLPIGASRRVGEASALGSNYASRVSNPIRLKNLRPRFLPFYLVAGVLLLSVRPEPAAYLAGLVAVIAGALLRT